MITNDEKNLQPKRYNWKLGSPRSIEEARVFETNEGRIFQKDKHDS